jgi:hypothetical protein
MTIDTDDLDPVIVIYGMITNENEYQTIKITSSSPYFDNQPNPPVSGAIVTVRSSENEIFIFEELVSEKGVYQSVDPMAGIPGLRYNLTIEVDFDQDGVKDVYKSGMTMQAPIEIDSVNIKRMDIMGRERYTLNLYGYEPPTEDYYLLRYSVNDSMVTRWLSQYEWTSDEFFNGDYVNGMILRFFVDVKDKDDFDDDNRIFVTPGDVITLHISRIEKGYFDFIVQCQNEMYGENPFFGGPASNITTNITNGGIGYFTGYITTTLKGIVPNRRHD